MKKAHIRWIIGMMSVAMLGLIVFQWYWIDSVISANELRFKQDVNEALNTVSQKLEKQEALAAMQYLQAPSQENFVRQWSSKGQLQVSDGEIVKKDTIIGPNGVEIVAEFKATGGGGLTYSFESSGISPEQVKELQKQNEKELEEINRQLQALSYKAEMAFSVIENVMVQEQSPLSRINPIQLDSILASELKNKGIDLPYNHAVILPKEKRFIYLKNPNQKLALQTSELRASLFPNDIVGEASELVIDFPDKEQYLLKKIWATMVSSGVLVMIIMFCFGYAMRIIVRQKKLSEMKNDFINNMTHELKTPIATISLATEALRDKDISETPGLRARYLKAIGDENLRLGDQVEKVLQMAALDRNDLNLKFEELNLKELLDEVGEKSILQVESRKGQFKLNVDSDRLPVWGDKVHLTNVFINLVDNAIKYSPEDLFISIRAHLQDDEVVISVQDHGIGMTKESIRNIFQKFYRVPTGNIHNVKGFGLGLAYVKSIVDAHGGNITVESEPGKGSKFIVSLPLHHG
ncbi:MAG: sensor histidine kinase [Bacteroidota bacterium]